MTKYEFGIRTMTLNNGKEILVPVICEVKRFMPKNWQRITKLYEKYLIQELDFNPELTMQDCKDHINGYKEVLRTKVENNIMKTELQLLED